MNFLFAFTSPFQPFFRDIILDIFPGPLIKIPLIKFLKLNDKIKISNLIFLYTTKKHFYTDYQQFL